MLSDYENIFICNFCFRVCLATV